MIYLKDSKIDKLRYKMPSCMIMVCYSYFVCVIRMLNAFLLFWKIGIQINIIYIILK